MKQAISVYTSVLFPHTQHTNHRASTSSRHARRQKRLDLCCFHLLQICGCRLTIGASPVSNLTDRPCQSLGLWTWSFHTAPIPACSARGVCDREHEHEQPAGDRNAFALRPHASAACVDLLLFSGPLMHLMQSGAASKHHLGVSSSSHQNDH